MLMTSSVPKNLVSRRYSSCPLRCHAVCSSAVRNASPIVIGTKKKWLIVTNANCHRARSTLAMCSSAWAGDRHCGPRGHAGHPPSWVIASLRPCSPRACDARAAGAAHSGGVTEHYDVIIVGTGAGGGTLAHTLAPSGKRILLLERGDFLPRETGNWDPGTVFVNGRYMSEDTWFDGGGTPFQPQVHYFVGGATKLFGAALYRLRPQDFGEIRHIDGLSPAWPLSYDDLEPYYTQAEQLYQVHGARGEDPTEPPASAPYPFPAVSHEPRIQQLSDDLAAAGLHPFHAPCGILLDEANPPYSTCVRCQNCDGFPCLVHAKSDAEVISVRPALEHSNVTLLTGAEAVRLQTDPAGTAVTGVVVNLAG